MKIDEILKLVNAGYSKEEIEKLDITDQKADQKADQKTDQKKDQKTDQKTEGFDYEKFATALVKAQQIANGKTNFGDSNEKTDISKFF